VQENRGAILAQTRGVGLGLGVGVAVADRLPDDGRSAECWLAGVNMLQPARPAVASRQPSATGSRTRRCVRPAEEGMPDRIRIRQAFGGQSPRYGLWALPILDDTP
jgi:hypothetical protein